MSVSLSFTSIITRIYPPQGQPAYRGEDVLHAPLNQWVTLMKARVPGRATNAKQVEDRVWGLMTPPPEKFTIMKPPETYGGGHDTVL